MKTPTIGDYVLIRSTGMKGKVIGITADKKKISYRVEYSFGGYKSKDVYCSPNELELIETAPDN